MITVTTAADTYSLISETAARAALDVPTGDDALIDAIIKRASDVIARHCRRVFAKETIEETFRPDQCHGELILSRYPVVSITSISENGNALVADDYELDKDKGFITRLHGSRPCYWSTWKTVVTYVAGYELPAKAPPALAQACIQLVKSYYVGADRDPMLRSESVGDVSSASFFDGDLPPDVRGLLTQFRNIRAR